MYASPALSKLFLLDPTVIFLNHGSFGACPRPVFEEYQRWQLELERQPVEFLGRRFDELMRAAREPLATYVGCAADELVYVPNATTGLNIVARSLKLDQGDVVLATDHEYGALDRTWTFLTERAGASYVRQPMPLPATTPAAFVEQFWSGVTRRTRVIFLSHISSPTALIFPVAEICERARAEGILTIVDGAHAPGQIPLDLSTLGADFYAGNCHKWMLAPKGSAFLYARPEVQSLVEPLVVSWGWRPETPGPSAFVQEQEWQGTRDPAAFLATPAAIEFMREHEWERVRAECQELARYAKRQLAELGLEPSSPDERDWFAQMVALELPECNRELLKRRLYDEYRIEVPIVEWNDRLLIRISVQGYNTRQEIDALVAAMGALLTQVRQTAEKY